MNPALRSAVALLWAVAAPAQQQASTLLGLAQSADVVVMATAGQPGAAPAGMRRIAFRVEESLKGPATAEFAVVEHDGRCCGASLLEVEAGSSYIVFLRLLGGKHHPLAGDRGIVRASADLAHHVRCLVATHGDPTRQATLLAQSLAHAEPRIAQDAALALAAHPQALRDAQPRLLLREALERCAAAPDTRLPALAVAFVRAEPQDATRELVDRYLTTSAEDTQSAMRRAVECLPSQDVAAVLRGVRTMDDTASVRAAELLAARPDPSQVDILSRLLRNARDPRAAAKIAASMLEHGVSDTTLQTHVHPSVAIAARKLRATRDTERRAAAPPR